MAKPHTLVTPYGETTIESLPTHVWIRTGSSLAGDWALGWYHGREAGDEAVFNRAFWRGELGTEGKPSPARTSLDGFIGQWGFANDLEQESVKLRPGDRARTQAYSQGFNQGRRRKLKEKIWSPEDCHLLTRTYGFLEWWETRAPQLGFLLDLWQKGLSWSRVSDLWPGLGPEPDKSAWDGISIPTPFDPETRFLVNRIRRFRPGISRTVQGTRTEGGRPCLAGSYVTDVTEPGLPFLGVRVDGPGKTVRGLSRPGHPGFLAGRTDNLAWHGTPVVDDTVDLRVVEGTSGRGLAGLWAGSGNPGTLQGLFLLEDATTAQWARDHCADLGSASLDFTAVDRLGGTAVWAQGRRWMRPAPRDAWLPAPWGFQVPGGPRPQPGAQETNLTGRWSTGTLEALLSRTMSELPGEVLPVLRFLLPDTEEGMRLRKWTGSPEDGPEASDFTRLFAALVECFWEGSPGVPDHNGPVFQALLPVMIKLVQAPHSTWFPSAEKNRRLAEAVRKAFAPGSPGGQPVLGRQAPKPCWSEVHGGSPRIFASTVAFTANMADLDWGVFLTDDETEVPVYDRW